MCLMAKVGRPKLDNKKIKKVTIRMSDEDYDRLIKYNEANDQTMTDTLLEAFNILMKTKKAKV